MARVRLLQRRIGVELLESRIVLSGVADAIGPIEFQDAITRGEVEVRPVVVSGFRHAIPSLGIEADSPDRRIDPNIPSSPFAGVGSLAVRIGGGHALCTATAISRTHVLTAAHCLDFNSDGRSDVTPDAVRFVINATGAPSLITGSELFIHPNFTGFARPSVNDDIAIVRLASEIPAAVPHYRFATAPLQPGQELSMVGYGRSSDGYYGLFYGYYVNGSFTTKRTGGNVADLMLADDESSGVNEVFVFDFDGPVSFSQGILGPGTLGGSSLGNTVEAQLGPGDSGGPSFVVQANEDGSVDYLVAGVNTFTAGVAPAFGSFGGGMIVGTYAGWINGVLGDGSSDDEDSSSDGDSGDAAPTSAELDDADLGVGAVVIFAPDSHRIQTEQTDSGSGQFDQPEETLRFNPKGTHSLDVAPATNVPSPAMARSDDAGDSQQLMVSVALGDRLSIDGLILGLREPSRLH